MASINQCEGLTKKLINVNCVERTDLPNAFNFFFSRFERSDFTHTVSNLRDSHVPRGNIVISQEQVVTLFKRTNIRKAAGPDAICGRALC